MRPHLTQRNGPRQSLDCLDVDHRPWRFTALAARIVMRILRVQSSVVGVSLSDDLHDTVNSRLITAGMVKECEIAFLHLVPQIVPRLEISDAIPVRRAVGQVPKIVERKRL